MEKPWLIIKIQGLVPLNMHLFCIYVLWCLSLILIYFFFLMKILTWLKVFALICFEIEHWSECKVYMMISRGVCLWACVEIQFQGMMRTWIIYKNIIAFYKFDPFNFISKFLKWSDILSQSPIRIWLYIDRLNGT